MFSMVGVSKTVEWRSREAEVLRNISVSVGGGEVVGIVDRHSVGVSTLLDMAFGLLKPDTGQILLGDVDLTRLPERRLEAARAHHFLWLERELELGHMTALEHIDLSMRISDAYRSRRERKQIDRVALYGLERMDSLELASIALKELSVWERVRVELARMIATRKRFVIINGLFDGLGAADAQEARWLLRIAVNEVGCGVLVRVSDPKSGWVADRVCTLDQGELTFLSSSSSDDGKVIALEVANKRSASLSAPTDRPLAPSSATKPSQAFARIDEMPAISRFFGITISMYYDDHQPPHLHVRSGEFSAKIRADTLELLVGDLPRREMRLVLAWAELHASDLMSNWQRARAGEMLQSIEPLR
jgi:ABC-type lipoprotein export system ATPase subunit